MKPVQFQNTLMEALGISLVEATPEKVVCTMPVNHRTHQPYGLLHGGASVALAETAASLAGGLNVDNDTHMPVGLEINANHLRTKADGTVTATAVPLHKGRTTMVFEVRITDEQNRLICISRCTLAIVKRRD